LELVHALPETRFAGTEGSYVAYQVFGEGPLNLVFIHSGGNVEVMWEEPSLARYLDRLASFSRVLCFDRRGTGVSDPVPLASLPSIELWMDDVRVAMDAAGLERAAVLGDAEGGPMAMLFAATYPERVSALALVNSFARFLRDEDYRIGLPLSSLPNLLDLWNLYWGTGFFVLTAPSTADDLRFKEWLGHYQRLTMPPSVGARTLEWALHLDVRAVLPNIRVPTVVIHRRDNLHHRVAFGRYLADHIPGARLVELPGADSYPFHAGDFGAVLDEVEEFSTGAREWRQPDRTLATVLFTDIVRSTETAAKLGDQRWLDLKDTHDSLVRRFLDRYRGREIKATGDGFLATFDGPARAVQAAYAIASALQPLGIEIRAGLHTGEIELRDDDIAGIAVHIAARVMAVAADGGILVSGTVKDLVVGSGIEFAERGIHTLKGVPGEWHLYQVTRVP
jgi:class 3 adenylate cyclase